MITLLFTVLMFMVFGKLILFALKASWGISKVLLTILFLPVILIVMAISGFVSIALPLLLIIGGISLIARRV